MWGGGDEVTGLQAFPRALTTAIIWPVARGASYCGGR